MDQLKSLDNYHSSHHRLIRDDLMDLKDKKKMGTCNKVLVVEDNLINQRVAQLFLKNLGYEANIAANGQQALAMFKPDYSLILMDLGLPDMDGIALAKEIRKQNKHIPIIACTASGIAYKEKCFDAGMDDFIVKPMMLEELKQILDKFLIIKKIN